MILVFGFWFIEVRGVFGVDGILVGSLSNCKWGGYGVIVKGKFFLYKGRILKILVGNEGFCDFLGFYCFGGGGGGIFVVYEDGKLLFVVGGGGGGGILKVCKYVCIYYIMILCWLL